MAHFRSDVASVLAAERILRDLLPGAHITWRSTDVDFVLSFLDRERVVQHVRIVRDPDGSFVLVDARPLQVFSTLSALVTSRKYLAVMAAESAAAATDGTGPSPSADGDAEVPASIAPPKPGSLSAAAAAARSGAGGGSATAAARDDGDDEAADGSGAAAAAVMRPQTRFEKTVTAVEFAIHGMCGAVLAAAGLRAGQAWLAHGDYAGELQAAAVGRFTGQVDAASVALAKDLHAVGASTAVVSDAVVAVSQCTAAAETWAAAVMRALTGSASAFGGFSSAAAADSAGSDGEHWSLLPSAVSQLSDFAPALTQALLLAVFVLLLCVALKPPQQVDKRTGDVHPLQSGWYRPRTLRAAVIATAWLVAAASGAALADSFWRLGTVSTHVEVASMPFLTPPPRQEVQMQRPGAASLGSENASEPLHIEAATVSVSPAPSHAAAALERGNLPFAYRDRGAAYAALGIPHACAAPLQEAIGAVARDGVTLLRAPLAAVLPPWLLPGSSRSFADACAQAQAQAKQHSYVRSTVFRSFDAQPPSSSVMAWLLVDCASPLAGSGDRFAPDAAPATAGDHVASAGKSAAPAASIMIPSHRGAAGMIVVGSSLLIGAVVAVVLLRTVTRDGLRWLSRERKPGHSLDDAVAAALAEQERLERRGADADGDKEKSE